MEDVFDMGYKTFWRREEERRGIGLGWLLLLAIGGAVLLFTAIGLLLAWKIRARRAEEEGNETTIYQISDSSDDHARPSVSRRLTKRKFLGESTSRLSLSLPPVLPPLPTYHSFGFLNGGNQGTRARSRSWVEEDKFHGPKISKSTRESWFSRDSWLGRVPTLPSLSLDDAEKGQTPVPQPMPLQMDFTGSEERLVVQKRRSPTAVLQQSKTAPALAEQEEVRGRVRAPVQALVRPSATDSDLYDILRLTEQRLREGQSQSPVKTPRSSPLKGSPVKTPHSYQSATSVRTTGTVMIPRMTPSPSKRATIHAQTPHTHSRNASISSIGSAANSLIAEAIQELELPGGLSSPSRLRGREWKAGENNLPEQGRRRSKSLDSDASSSLSTLYSVGEPDEKKEVARDDPFVEQGMSGMSTWDDQPPPIGRRSSKRRNKALSAVNLPRPDQVKSTSPFRQHSYSTQAVGGSSLSFILQPPAQQTISDEVNPKSARIGLAFPVSESETSMVTPTVTTVSDLEEDDDRLLREAGLAETPKADWIPPRHERTSATSPGPAPSSAASSPYDERDIISLLLSSSVPRRDLPDPPPRANQAVPTSLRRNASHPARTMSTASNSSSAYEAESIGSPAAVSSGSPTRRPTIRAARDTSQQGSVTTSIQELRRMNSMISSYSVASVTSTIQDTDSPTLPALRGGGFATSKSSSIGSKNYLSLGTPPKKNPRRAIHRVSSVGLGITIREDAIDEGKENESPKQKAPKTDFQGLREARRGSGNQGHDAAPGKAKLGAVGELVAEHARQADRMSAESLGLYDKDGFLKSSPDRDAQRRSLRM